MFQKIVTDWETEMMVGIAPIMLFCFQFVQRCLNSIPWGGGSVVQSSSMPLMSWVQTSNLLVSKWMSCHLLTGPLTWGLLPIACCVNQVSCFVTKPKAKKISPIPVVKQLHPQSVLKNTTNRFISSYVNQINSVTNLAHLLIGQQLVLHTLLMMWWCTACQVLLRMYRKSQRNIRREKEKCVSTPPQHLALPWLLCPDYDSFIPRASTDSLHQPHGVIWSSYHHSSQRLIQSNGE
jgi:hypothetical protein